MSGSPPTEPDRDPEASTADRRSPAQIHDESVAALAESPDDPVRLAALADSIRRMGAGATARPILQRMRLGIRCHLELFAGNKQVAQADGQGSAATAAARHALRTPTPPLLARAMRGRLLVALSIRRSRRRPARARACLLNARRSAQ